MIFSLFTVLSKIETVDMAVKVITNLTLALMFRLLSQISV